MTKITLEEWRAALAGLDAPATDAHTIADWARRMNIPRAHASDWIRVGLNNGWMAKANTLLEELTGRHRRVVGFRLTDEGGGNHSNE